jgi:hypothetical protein
VWGLRRHPAQRPLFTQAPGRAGRPGAGVHHSVELLLRPGWLSAADDAALGAVPREPVYLGAVVVLVTAMAGGITAARAARLRAWLGVSVRTLKRWRAWWRETFVASPFWRGVKGRFMPPVAVDTLPASLLERFAGADERTRLLQTLAFLGPLTTGRAVGVAGSPMGDGDPQTMRLARRRSRS